MKFFQRNMRDLFIIDTFIDLRNYIDMINVLFKIKDESCIEMVQNICLSLSHKHRLDRFDFLSLRDMY